MGETREAAAMISAKKNFPIIDLKTKNILEFDYDFNNRDDDFLKYPGIDYIADIYFSMENPGTNGRLILTGLSIC